MGESQPMLPQVEAPRPTRIRWFSGGGSVEDIGGVTEVRVHGVIIGRFQVEDVGARNVILVGLAEDPRAHLGYLAEAFDLSAEMLRLIRRQYERGGLKAIAQIRRGGREPIVDEALRAELVQLFEAGESVSSAYARVRAKTKIGRTTVGVERQAWERLRKANVEAAKQAEPPTQGELPLSADLAAPAAAAERNEVRAEESSRDTAAAREGSSPNARVQGTRGTDPLFADGGTRSPMVQHVGAWLLLGQLRRYPLHAAAEEICARNGLDRAAVRLAMDAFAVALAQGEGCAEGVRRLATSTAPLLLSCERVPCADSVRRTLGRLADVGADELHAEMVRRTLALARADSGPAVFFLDGHMRPYTGQEVLRRGWRMQAKRVQPGATDYYLHHGDGRPLFRMTSPSHAPLTDVVLPIADTVRATLGDDQRLLFVFDRAGAFPDAMSELRNESFEFVTYERRPYRILRPADFVREMVLGDDDGKPEVLRFAEFTIALGKGRGDVRRIAVLTPDARQVNILAISAEPAERLVALLFSRWCQENGLKHGVERWGSNQLDGRGTMPYAPDTIVPNPARRKLDHELRLARVQEGLARNDLADYPEGAPRHAKALASLADAIQRQAELRARRATTPARAPLAQTELAGKLVYHQPGYKLLLDTIRIACANAEEDLVEMLAPHLPRAAEAKKSLATLFAAPGYVSQGAHSITVVLDPAGTTSERMAYDRLYAKANTAALSLPGDPRHRRLVFRSQV